LEFLKKLWKSASLRVSEASVITRSLGRSSYQNSSAGAQRRYPYRKKEKQKHEAQLAIDTKELERLEIEKAIAMSLAVEEKTQEEKELEEAIRQSQL
jgi:hypothetical protein